ncbi:MAG TPA: outer membrane protein [Xanthobacteraceae bacterium]|jgi:outer membrane immunogenic protein
MRKVVFGFVAIGALMATPVLAADLARRAPTPYYKAPPPQAFSWTGCYVGADVGGGWVTDKDSETFNGGVSPFSPISSAKTAGVLAGGYVGCDYQFSSGIVVGALGDGQWADIRGGTANFNTPAPPDFYQPRADFEASARARVGYAFDRTLVYVTGGAAWLHVKEHDVFQVTGVTQDTSKAQPGWTVGGGFDYAFTNNLIGRVEYRYSDFGNFSYNLVAFPGFTENHKLTENQVLVGLHYKFGSPYAAAPY